MIRVGVVDSGIDGAARGRVIAARDFPAGSIARVPANDAPRDHCAHGSRVAAILAAVPAVELLDARVMFATLRSSAAQLASAIDWLCTQQVQVINLSLGLREDRDILRAACQRAVAGGVLLVASSPARGSPVFPAAYPAVIRATGDARCAAGEISWLATPQADFGGHPRAADDTLGGASMGCAQVCAVLAAWLAVHLDAGREAAIAALQAASAYRGAERRMR